MPKQPARALNLEALRKQAKRLLREHRARDLAAAQFFAAWHPRFGRTAPEAILATPLQHSDALLAIARREGYANWPALVAQADPHRRAGG